MPSERDLSPKKLGISRDAYRELRYFCRQYPEKKRRVGRRTGDRLPPVVEQRYRKDLELIEQAAFRADSGIRQQLIENVTTGTCYWDLIVPCSKNYFYEKRLEFFRQLAHMKHMI